MMENNDFKISMPAHLEKAKDGEWRIKGLASTEAVDQQGEQIILKGADLTPIDQKKGWFNFDHQPGAANLIGTIDGYAKTDKGLIVSGRLFKNHVLAKHVHDIMSSLSESDRGRIGMSVEGSVIQRNPLNSKIIEKCRIKNVALTFSPVNLDTYVDLEKSQKDSQEILKSLVSAEVDFDTTRTFSSEEVVELLQKALGIGAGSAAAPNTLTGGDALTVSNMAEKPKKKKKLKKMSDGMYKSLMLELMDKLQKLYPDNSRSEIWSAVSERLERTFPEIK